MISRLLLTIAVMTLISCNLNKQELRPLQLLLSEIDDPGKISKFDYFMLIPLGGCQYCVLKSIEFSKQHIGSNKIAFILTSMVGQKEITLNYSPDQLTAENMIVDGEGKAYASALADENVKLLIPGKKKLVVINMTPATYEDELVKLKENLISI